MFEKGQASRLSQRWSLWLCAVKLNGVTVVICTQVRPVWKLGPALFKESSSPWGCQNHSPTLSLFIANTKSRADQVAVRAYSGKDKEHKSDF